jgi:hypothetical protein
LLFLTLGITQNGLSNTFSIFSKSSNNVLPILSQAINPLFVLSSVLVCFLFTKNVLESIFHTIIKGEENDQVTI